MIATKVWSTNLFHKTVWSRHNRADIPARYAFIYTFVLPLKFFLIGLYGAMSIGAPITSIDIIFGVIYGDIWSFGLMLTGWGSLLGIAFYPRLIRLEGAAITFMLVLMGFYMAAIFLAAAFHAEPLKYLSLVLVIVFMPMPSWRLFDIVRELRPAQ